MGIFRILISYCGLLRDHLLQDVALLVAATLEHSVTTLVEIIQQPKEDMCSIKDHFEFQWKQYQGVVGLADRINNSYFVVLSLMHFNMVLMITYFLMEPLEPENITISWYLLVFGVVKGLLIYFRATKISDQVFFIIIVSCIPDEHISFKNLYFRIKLYNNGSRAFALSKRNFLSQFLGNGQMCSFWSAKQNAPQSVWDKMNFSLIKALQSRYYFKLYTINWLSKKHDGYQNETIKFFHRVSLV